MDYQKEIEKGEALFSSGRIDEAQALFEFVIQNQPDNLEALNNIGVIQHAKGNSREAEKHFQKALALKGDYVDARLNLADLYQNTGSWQKAAGALERYLETESRDPHVYNQLGMIYLEMGDTSKASAVLEKSLALNPNQKIVQESLEALEGTAEVPRMEIREKNLSILFVQEFPCIRNYKMATALRSRGHSISLAYTKARLSQMYKGLDDDVYDESIRLTSHRHLWDITKNYDLVHCHNEPDVLTVAALAGDAPVVHDTHDLISLRANNDPNLSYFEGIANRGAAGRVYTTSYQMEEASKLYGTNGPSLVLCNYVSEADLPKKFLPKLSEQDGNIHIVYEGGIGGNGHRDFSSQFVDLANRGLHIHIYPTSYDEEIARHFSTFKTIHYYEPLSPKQIIEEMSQYDFGIIPFNLRKGNKRFLDSTIANKLFEYMAARLPVIAASLHSYVEYFESNPVGITFSSVDDIIEGIPRLKEIKEKTDFSENIFTYEKEITKIEQFYYSILNNNVSRNLQYITNDNVKAKTYWKNREILGCYFEEGRQSATIVNTIRQLCKNESMESVLEFGCNVGRNLHCLRRDISGLRLLGIDINEEAIDAGRDCYNLPLIVGSEEKLLEMDDGAYDVVFTVSVLDHIPRVEEVLKELLRVTSKYFIALEPYSGANEDAKRYAIADYSYFWDYPSLFAKLDAVLIHDEPCPLGDRGLGPFYRLYIAKPAAAIKTNESDTKLGEDHVEQNSNPYLKRSNHLVRRQKDSTFYDQLYLSGGWQKEYHKHYTERVDYKSWKKTLEWIKLESHPEIIEIGCGTGQFANMLLDNGISNYHGIDFSPIAIDMAKKNNSNYTNCFTIDNALSSNIYTSEYNIAILLEVLEHIDDDLHILANIKDNCTVIFSVPNFDSASHVRWFNTRNAILARYGDIVDIEDIYEIELKPTLNKIYLAKAVKKPNPAGLGSL